MIDKIIINKSIETAIYKCSQGYTLNKKVVSAFNTFHDKTCGKKLRKTELGLVTDSNGNVLYTPKGNKEELTGLSWSKMHDLYMEYGELHLTHNHPRGNTYIVAECLSSGDVDCLFETYRPYGKRPDGSEGYLVGEEGVYFTKSISCESGNGSRMTLVRGDNFKHDNQRKAEQLGHRLSDYWADYEKKYYETLAKIRRNVDYSDFDSSDSYEKYLHNQAIKEIGVFEKNDEFKDIQKGFHDVDCKLTYTFPREYRVGIQ